MPKIFSQHSNEYLLTFLESFFLSVQFFRMIIISVWHGFELTSSTAAVRGNKWIAAERIIRNCWRELLGCRVLRQLTTLHTVQRVDKLLQAARNGGEWCSKGYPGVVVEPLAVHKRNGSNNKLGNQLSVRNGNFAGSQDKWLVRQAGQRGQGGEREGRELTCCSRRGRNWVKHTASWARDLSRRFSFGFG